MICIRPCFKDKLLTEMRSTLYTYISVWSPGIEFGSGAVYKNSVCDRSEGYSARSKSPGRLPWRSETRVSSLVDFSLVV